MSYKVIFSLTTSPSRLLNLESVIESLLHQDYPIEGIEINLPLKYKNSEEYIIPDFLATNESGICIKYPKVKIFRIEKDLGPGTKIIPTLMRYLSDEKVYLISVDDDNRYPERLASSLLKGLVLYGNDKIYCFGGYDLKVASKCRLELNEKFIEKRVTVIEGVYGVLYNPRLFKTDIWDYFQKVIVNKECFTSDDITISNYISMKNIPIHKLYFKTFNKLLFWKQMVFKGGAVKDSKNDKNAIHKMPGGHKKRYFQACVYLKEQNMLYLPISTCQR